MASAIEVRLLNLAKIQARLNKLPAATTKALQDQMKTEADEMVAAIKRAAPVDTQTRDTDQHLRDSVRAVENKDRVIGYRIIADATDEANKYIGSNVEAGHRAVNGEHVAARPFFFPTYRARKKAMQRRLRKAARDVIKQTWGA